MLTFAGGGWVLLVAGVLVLATVAWRVVAIVGSSHPKRIGDGKTVASYGFDLSTCVIPRDEILAGGRPRDGIPALTNPAHIPAAQVSEIRRENPRDKFLLPGDRVIGVCISGQARVYPPSILNWHEAVNDILGGQPILVTYCHLCDSVAVYDRRIDGETLEFGVSGLLYNSNTLLYDRRSEGQGESLWTQLDGRAVAGPAAAGTTLTSLPVAFVRWDDWLERYPDTTVLDRDPARKAYYKTTPYANYFGSDELLFPVRPLPHVASLHNKSRVVIVSAGGQRRVFPLPVLSSRVDSSGTWTTTLGETALRFDYRPDPGTVWVTPERPDAPVEVRYAFWFAWYSMHPGDRVEGIPQP